MGRKSKLDRYRDQVEAIFHANVKAVLRDSQWTDQEKAGTLVIIATAAISHAAFLTASVTPHLKNAPPEAQIADLIDLLRETMTSGKPISGGLRVVKE